MVGNKYLLNLLQKIKDDKHRRQNIAAHRSLS